MSKWEWFRHFEEVDAEHPELSEDEKVTMAEERHVDEMAARADQIRDEAKYETRRDGP